MQERVVQERVVQERVVQERVVQERVVQQGAAEATCCAALLRSPLSEAEAATLASAFKVLADPVRLRLLSLIAGGGSETCACDLVAPLGRSQPTVSHHLSVLTEAGLVTREQRGRWAWYRAVPERLAVLSDALAPASDTTA